MSDQHHNFEYDGGSPDIPIAVGDRYYSQDLARDFWHNVKRSGLAIQDLIKNKAVVIGQIDIRQKSGTDLLSIPSITFYGSRDIKVPTTAATPPVVETQKVPFVRAEATFREFDIVPTATLDGATINYVKIKYTDVDGPLRARAKLPGSYPFQQTPGAILTVDSTPPTGDEILLKTLIGAGGGAPWILFKNKDLGIIDLPKYIANTGVGDARRAGADHQNDIEIMKRQVAFGTKFDEINKNRLFNHNYHAIEIGIESPEINLVGPGWAISTESTATQGAVASTSTIGDSAEFSFFGTHISIMQEHNNTFQARNVDVEFKVKNGTFTKINLANNTDNNVGSTGLRKAIIAKNLPLDDYVVKVTTRTTDQFQFSAFAYGTYVIQNPASNYFLNGQHVRSVNNGTDTITSDHAHNLVNDDQIIFRFANANGGIPSIVPGTIYFVIVVSPTTFQISATSGGPLFAIGGLTDSVTWFGVVCANRPTTIEEIPIGDTFVNNASNITDGNGGSPLIVQDMWNTLGLRINAEEGFVEYRFIGNRVWCILAPEQSANIDLTFTIDGSSSKIKLAQPINLTNVQVQYDSPPNFLQVDDGTLKHGLHTVRLTTNNFSSTAQILNLSGWFHHSKIVYNDIHKDDVDFANDKILLTDHEYNNDELIVLDTSGIAPAGLTMGVERFIVNATADDFQLSLTKGGVAIVFTDAGQGLLNIIKVRSSSEQSYILGENTDLFPAADTRITYTGTFAALANSRLDWRSQNRISTTLASKASITTPTADVRAIYYLHRHVSDTKEYKVTLAGGSIKMITDRLPSAAGAITGMHCIYDKVIDGDLSNKLIEVELFSGVTGTGFVSNGFIVEIADPTSKESIWVMQKWMPFGDDANERQSVTNVHRLEVYGSKTDNRSGIIQTIKTPWRSATANFFDHFPFAEHPMDTKPMVNGGVVPNDSRSAHDPVYAGTIVSPGNISLGIPIATTSFGRVIYSPSEVD